MFTKKREAQVRATVSKMFDDTKFDFIESGLYIDYKTSLSKNNLTSDFLVLNPQSELINSEYRLIIIEKLKEKILYAGNPLGATLNLDSKLTENLRNSIIINIDFFGGYIAFVLQESIEDGKCMITFAKIKNEGDFRISLLPISNYIYVKNPKLKEMKIDHKSKDLHFSVGVDSYHIKDNYIIKIPTKRKHHRLLEYLHEKLIITNDDVERKYVYLLNRDIYDKPRENELKKLSKHLLRQVADNDHSILAALNSTEQYGAQDDLLYLYDKKTGKRECKKFNIILDTFFLDSKYSLVKFIDRNERLGFMILNQRLENCGHFYSELDQKGSGELTMTKDVKKDGLFFFQDIAKSRTINFFYHSAVGLRLIGDKVFGSDFFVYSNCNTVQPDKMVFVFFRTEQEEFVGRSYQIVGEEIEINHHKYVKSSSEYIRNLYNEFQRIRVKKHKFYSDRVDVSIVSKNKEIKLDFRFSLDKSK